MPARRLSMHPCGGGAFSQCGSCQAASRWCGQIPVGLHAAGSVSRAWGGFLHPVPRRKNAPVWRVVRQSSIGCRPVLGRRYTVWPFSESWSGRSRLCTTSTVSSGRSTPATLWSVSHWVTASLSRSPRVSAPVTISMSNCSDISYLPPARREWITNTAVGRVGGRNLAGVPHMGQKVGDPDPNSRFRSSWRASSRILSSRLWRFASMRSFNVSASITITSSTSVATMAAAAAAMLYPPSMPIKVSMWVCQSHPASGLLWSDSITASTHPKPNSAMNTTE